MALRIIEVHVAPGHCEEAREALLELSHETWTQQGGRFGSIVFAVLGAQRSGEALDRLYERLMWSHLYEGLRDGMEHYAPILLERQETKSAGAPRPLT